MAHQNEHSREEDVKKLASLIKDVRICMMTTLDTSGHLRSRPMAVQQTNFDGDLWFFTGKSTSKTDEIQHDSHVNVSFANPDDNQYVSVSGRAQLVNNPAKAKELWNPAYKAWFPKGLDDPDLTLLKVSVDKAEYWDSPNSTMVQLYGFAKAIVAGERANVGEHEKLSLSK